MSEQTSVFTQLFRWEFDNPSLHLWLNLALVALQIYLAVTVDERWMSVFFGCCAGIRLQIACTDRLKKAVDPQSLVG